MRHEVIVGVERRRRFTIEQKMSILAEVGIDGATVADVARRHDLTRRHIYQWRRELRRKGHLACPGETVFLALDAPAEPGPAGTERPGEDVRVEIVLRNGRELRCRRGIGDADLARLIRVVETA